MSALLLLPITDLMRICAWNCRMAFRKKWRQLDHFAPDIVVISEIESFDRLSSYLPIRSNQMLWTGSNFNKGLGVISLNPEFTLRQLPRNPASLARFVIPVEVSGPVEFSLLALWTQNEETNRPQRYSTQAWDALQSYHEEFGENVIVAGDLNWNTIWDNQSNLGATFEQLSKFLSKRGIRNLYHAKAEVEHGYEADSTFFMYSNPVNGYHTDYIFASEALRSRLIRFELPCPQDWLKLSDHVPLLAEFD